MEGDELWGSAGDVASCKRLPINQKLKCLLSTNQNLQLSLNQSEKIVLKVNRSIRGTKIDLVSIRI